MGLSATPRPNIRLAFAELTAHVAGPMTTMTQVRRRLAGALLVSMPAWLPAAAQDSTDVQALQDRLRRLDRELVAVQQQVYRGTAAPRAGAPPAAPPVAPPTDAQGSAAATLQTRINALDGELRSTTGQIEEVNFAVGDI